ncbi:S1C family serine protease [Catenulispora subtropica]|uniref:PDZ domain-containing protein n=1 Tax=Catenulispora subtropica TaxID=450798 RepID=A0ABN2T8K2_9ACTN
MNEPSSNAGGVGGLGENGAGEAAHQDVRDTFGANPATSGGSGAQDPNATTASFPAGDGADPLAGATAPTPAAADQPTLIQPADEQTLVQPAVQAAQPDPAAGQGAPATQAAQAQAAPVPPAQPGQPAQPAQPTQPGQPTPPGQPTQPGAAFGQAAQQHTAQQPGNGNGTHLGPGPTPPPNWAAPSDAQTFPPYMPPGSQEKRSASGASKMLVAVALVAGLIGGGIGTAVTYAVKDSGTASASPTSSGRAPLNTNNTALNTPGSVTQVASSVMPSVVDIQVSTSDGSGDEGTGIIYSSDGLIVTNNHVVAAAAAGNSNSNSNQQQNNNPFGGDQGNNGSTKGTGGPATITVTFNDGKTATAHVVGTEPLADLAVIKADGVSGLTKASFADSKNLAVGQQVVAIGSPLGLTSTVTSGIVSALNRPVQTQGDTGQTVVLDAVQTDAAINPGNSGGPLTDMQGNVIGINSAIASNSKSGGLGGSSEQAGSIGLGFAIPISEALPIVDALAKGQPAQIASLGVQQSGNGDTTTRTTKGYKVEQVPSGGPADKAGLKSGDVITKIGDRLVYSYADVAAAVRSHRPNDTIPVTFTRDGSSNTVNVTLGVLKVPTAPAQ